MNLILYIVAAKIPFERVKTITVQVKSILMNFAIPATALTITDTKLTIFLTSWTP